MMKLFCCCFKQMFQWNVNSTNSHCLSFKCNTMNMKSIKKKKRNINGNVLQSAHVHLCPFSQIYIFTPELTQDPLKQGLLLPACRKKHTHSSISFHAFTSWCLHTPASPNSPLDLLTQLAAALFNLWGGIWHITFQSARQPSRQCTSAPAARVHCTISSHSRSSGWLWCLT